MLTWPGTWPFPPVPSSGQDEVKTEEDLAGFGFASLYSPVNQDLRINVTHVSSTGSGSLENSDTPVLVELNGVK